MTNYIVQISKDDGASWITVGGYAQRAEAFRNYIKWSRDYHAQLMDHGVVILYNVHPCPEPF